MKFYIQKTDDEKLIVELKDKLGNVLMMSPLCNSKQVALNICAQINMRTDMDIEIVDLTK